MSFALPLAPPITLEAKPEQKAFRGQIIRADGALGARTLLLYSTPEAAKRAADALWKRLRGQAAEVDL